MVTFTSARVVVVVVTVVVVVVIVVVYEVCEVVVVGVVVVVVVDVSVVEMTMLSSGRETASSPHPVKHSKQTKDNNNAGFFIKTSYFIPVEPNPPAPRSVSVRLSASS